MGKEHHIKKLESIAGRLGINVRVDPPMDHFALLNAIRRAQGTPSKEKTLQNQILCYTMLNWQATFAEGGIDVIMMRKMIDGDRQIAYINGHLDPRRPLDIAMLITEGDWHRFSPKIVSGSTVYSDDRNNPFTVLTINYENNLTEQVIIRKGHFSLEDAWIKAQDIHPRKWLVLDSFTPQVYASNAI